MNDKLAKIMKKKARLKPVTFVLAVLLILAIIFYCAGGLSVYRSTSANNDKIADTVERLTLLENRPVTDLTGWSKKRRIEVDINELRSRLLENYGDYDYNSENFRRWFSDAAIVGDSIAEAIKGFGWVNDINVQSEVGIGLYSSQNVIDGTILLQPTTIFLTFSANDIASYSQYLGDDKFIEDYTEIVKRLQENVPQAEIYVQGILPCSVEFLDEYWYYQNLDLYNSNLEKMCEDLGVHYYNVNFILEAHPTDYAEDGFHPNWQFYPLWLTYMAEISGLADDSAQE